MFKKIKHFFDTLRLSVLTAKITKEEKSQVKKLTQLEQDAKPQIRDRLEEVKQEEEAIIAQEYGLTGITPLGEEIAEVTLDRLQENVTEQESELHNTLVHEYDEKRAKELEILAKRSEKNLERMREQEELERKVTHEKKVKEDV